MHVALPANERQTGVRNDSARGVAPPHETVRSCAHELSLRFGTGVGKTETRRTDPQSTRNCTPRLFFSVWLSPAEYTLRLMGLTRRRFLEMSLGSAVAAEAKLKIVSVKAYPGSGRPALREPHAEILLRL